MQDSSMNMQQYCSTIKQAERTQSYGDSKMAEQTWFNVLYEMLP